jgi:hypothetical protein
MDEKVKYSFHNISNKLSYLRQKQGLSVSTLAKWAGFTSGPFAVESRIQRQEYNALTKDELVKSPKTVTPVKTGAQNCLNSLDSCFRRNDKKTEL